MPEIDDRQTMDPPDPPSLINICSMAVLACQEHAATVDGHDLVPVSRCGFDHRRQRDDAGIRDGNIQPAAIAMMGR